MARVAAVTRVLEAESEASSSCLAPMVRASSSCLALIL